MTTKVTIDAHAGWPVKVVRINPDTQERLDEDAYPDEIVQPGEVREFYVHSTMALEVYEMPR